MDFKRFVKNYLETHNVSILTKYKVEEALKRCYTNEEVYHRILQLDRKFALNNCKLRGFDNYVPDIEDELVCDDILKQLNRLKQNENQEFTR